MKKFKSILVTLAMLLCAISASAEDFSVDGIYYNFTDSEKLTVEVTRGSSSNSYSGDVVIPETVTYESKSYAVTSIGSYAFRYCRSLTSVTIPNSVTSIGSGAFIGCSSLTSINIPDGVTSIGEYAFEDCSSLTSVTIGNGVTSIGRYAFRDCSSLTSVTIGNGVTSIGDQTFYNCSSLTSVTIGNSVTSIDGWAFYGCSSLTSVTIPNSVTSIGNDAFGGCSSLTSVTLGNSVTRIGGAAFSGCSSLTSINIPNSVISIGGAAFAYCSSLPSITIPNSDMTIPKDVFTGCESLAYIYCNVKNIVEWFCSNLRSLKEVVLGDSVKSIGDYAFWDCSLTSVTLGNSVTSIGEYAFYRNSLTSITIPNSVTSIGEYAFLWCRNLRTVINNSNLNLTKGSSSNGAVAYYAYRILTGEPIDGFYFEEKKGAYYLTGYVGNEQSIVLPNTYKGNSYSIGGSAFRGTSLTSITIPNIVASIDSFAFANCKKLENVYCFAEIVPTTVSDAFDDSYPENATLHVPAASIDSYRSTVPWSSFGKIVELESSSIDDIKTLPYNVVFSHGTITVTGTDDGTMVEVYGISGTKLGEAKTAFNTATISIGQHADNIVIVKVGNKSIKIRI